MAHSSISASARSLSLRCAAAFLCLVATGCGSASPLLEARSLDCSASGDCAPDPDGDDPASFCDDGNPCTAKANCTPCSTLPPSERDIHHCTADDELPPFCDGRTGCVHVPLTATAGQIESCFPVAEAADLHAGVCRAGRCADEGA